MNSNLWNGNLLLSVSITKEEDPGQPSRTFGCWKISIRRDKQRHFQYEKVSSQVSSEKANVKNLKQASKDMPSAF